MGSSGITTLIGALNRAQETGRSFALRSPSASGRLVLDITGVDAVLTVEPSR
jgi:anti-anti-sigma regulatory factor